MLTALDSARSGLDAAAARLDQAAGDIARAGADALVPAAGELKQAGHAARANLAVLRTADEMIGTLLDVLA